MEILWKFLKQGFFVVVGTITLPILLTIFFDLGFIKVSMLTGLFAAGGIVYVITSTVKNVKKAFKPSPVKSYLNENVKEAKRDVRKIKSAIYEIPAKRQQPFVDLYKSVRHMVEIVDKQPQKYTQAKSFFNDLLPNAKTIVERYQYLINQPIQSEEIKETLRNTEKTVIEMKTQVDKELLVLLSDDAMKLDLDLEYIKNNTKHNDDQHRPF
ncbi:MAG: 5-bromo-4-chloroindolyl phosphate hydrolysis family protein [Bacillaceae bacterium]